MPLLRSGTDRAVLRVGNNPLGGRGADSLPVAALAWQPPVASITVPAHGPVLIRRLTASVVVRLDEQPLRAAPRPGGGPARRAAPRSPARGAPARHSHRHRRLSPPLRG